MSIKLKGSSDGSVSFDAPADTSPSGSDITLTLPTSAGSANQFLKNSGIAGELEYSSMVETSTGIGIGGVTSPFDKLQVRTVTDANFVFSSAGGTEASFEVFNNAGSSNTPLNYRASEHKFKIQANEKMRLDSSGRLGIGTATPSDANSNADDLVIKATGSGAGITIFSDTNNFGNIFFGDSSSAAHRGRVRYDHTNDALTLSTTATERVRIQSTGYTQFGGYLNGTGSHRLNGINATQGDALLVISGYQLSGGSSQDTGIWYSVNTGGSVSSTAAGLRMYKNTGTNRSINTAGTINASGADYAEYMTKAGDFTLAKGDICGINSEGKLTNVFADAISFVVKSTDPSYVGGDKWHEAVGEEPGGYDDDRTEEEIAAATVAYEEALEAARQLVDRIAFSGQVPVNVTGATPGQHIIPTAAADGSIEGTAKAEADLTMAEYMSSVGKVIAIEDDGRAKIIVKVA